MWRRCGSAWKRVGDPVAGGWGPSPSPTVPSTRDSGPGLFSAMGTRTRSGTCPQVWVTHTWGNATPQKLFVHLRVQCRRQAKQRWTQRNSCCAGNKHENQLPVTRGAFWRALLRVFGVQSFPQFWCAGTEVLSCSFISRNVNVNRV